MDRGDGTHAVDGPTPARVGVGCLAAFFAVFAVAGAAAVVGGARQLAAGRERDAWVACAVGGLFLVVGAGGIAFAVVAGRRARAGELRRARFPDEPWRWREDWERGRIECSTRGSFLATLVVALFWNAVSAPAVVGFALEEGLRFGDPRTYAVLLFPAVGLGLGAWAVRAGLRWRRFGVSVVELARVPGVVGGYLDGVVVAPTRVVPADGFDLELSAIRRTRSGSGDDGRTDERVLWQERQRMRAERILGAPGTRVPFAFTIPGRAPESDERDASNRVIWRLRVSAEVPGVDYAPVFELPVFRTDESVDDPAARPDPAGALRIAAPRPVPEEHGIELRPRGRDALEVRFGALRNRGLAFGLAVFVLLWSGAIWMQVRFGAPLLFPIVFGLFELLLIGALAGTLFGRSRIEVAGGRVRVSSTVLGFTRERELDAGAVAEVRVEVGGSSQSAGHHTPYWDVVARTRGAERVRLGGAIRERAVAEHLASALRSALGLEAGSPPSGT